ncbi:unnamed protein product [Leptidea sinapis]|uniref:PBZ-type domain-containing protein n=2 Tax=Leptidea sinapis TaxID=189913 RepID=A0A5E4QZL0_9NEOP|nr:unnamed protein product [Leptidea sinapis]
METKRTMSDDWKAYVSDTRTICKYGAKCYQKNPEHHKTYKHPPNLKAKNTPAKKRFTPYNTNRKPDERNTAATTENIESSERWDCKESTQHLKNSTLDINEDSLLSIVEVDGDTTLYGNETDNRIFKECFLVEMPNDFFKFYECLCKESSSVESLMASVNLELVGPFDLVSGKLPKLEDTKLYLSHWRFFYDPPEFQTVLKKRGNSEVHIGYYRDDPNSTPAFLAVNDSSKDHQITPIAENIFGAVYWFLQNEKTSSPFMSMVCQKLSDKVKKWAEENNYSVQECDKKKRLQQIVCKTFHGAGIVVPYNKKTQLGYRKLVESDSNLKKLFKKLAEATSDSEKDKILSDLQPVITYSSIAMDECDFGTGLEAGIALFCSGLKELHSSVLSLLTSAYSLLQREEFGKIIESSKISS